MRILIYIEPHPIRDSMAAYKYVAYYFARMLKEAAKVPDDCEFRIYSNTDILGAVLSRFDGLQDYCLMPTEAEQTLFEANLSPWLNEGIQHWIDLANGHGIADKYYDLLGDIHSRFPFDVVVHWGANGAAARFCDDNRVGRVAMELGCTRNPYRNTIVFDPYGANGGASPSLVDLFDMENAIGGKETSAELDLISYSDPEGRSVSERRFDYMPALDEQILGMAAGRKIAFLPLQLHDDANLLLYSDFSSSSEVVDRILPQLSEAGYFCFIKPHPGILRRPGGRAELHRIQQAVYGSSMAFCLDQNAGASSNTRIFELSDLVVTVNSSVGFEATLHDKPVCVLGKAIYKPGNLFPEISDVVSGYIDDEDYIRAYRQRIGKLRTFFLDAYLVPQETAFNLEGFTKRVRQLSMERNSPADAVRAIYRQFGAEGREQRLSFLTQQQGQSTSSSKQSKDPLLASVQANVTALLGSTSWRVTRPLRLFGARLRGVRYKDPSTPKSVAEGIRTMGDILSSSSWALTWPVRFAKDRLSSLKSKQER